MIDINKLKLTDMGNPELIPQLVEEMNTKFIKEEEKIICEKLFDLDIDKDILINQTQEINRLNDILREYKELEEQGLLLKLPYNIANHGIVYFVDEKDLEIYQLRSNKIEISKMMISNEFYYTIDSFDFSYEDFGKTVFLTREEAEQELKRLEGK